MKSIASLQNIGSNNGLEYQEQFKARFGQYLERQHPVIRALHLVLMGVALFCMALAGICLIAALYQTCLWAITGSFTSLGKATLLPIAWVNYGLSMSLLVFPWGLDSMLMRIFPAIIFPAAWYRSKKAINFHTGIGAFFAGFGIMCAGAPGAAYFIELATQALQKLF